MQYFVLLCMNKESVQSLSLSVQTITLSSQKICSISYTCRWCVEDFVSNLYIFIGEKVLQHFLLARQLWCRVLISLTPYTIDNINIFIIVIHFIFRVFQEMLYGISTGFGSPQVPVAELLARAVPSLPSPQKPKSSNFLQVPDIETPR